MKNIFTQSTERQNSCRNPTSLAIAHGRGVDNGCCSCQAEHSFWFDSRQREPTLRKPRLCPRLGFSSFSPQRLLISITLTNFPFCPATTRLNDPRADSTTR